MTLMFTFKPKCIKRRWRTTYPSHTQLRKIFLLCLILCILILTTQINFNNAPQDALHYDGFVVDTDGCTIPAMKPINKLVEKFVKYPSVPSCPNANFSLLLNNRSHIWINYENKILKHYRLSDREKINCCYQSFFRPDEINNVNSYKVDDKVEYNDCVYFMGAIDVHDKEYVRVTCYYEEDELIKQYFIFAPEKKLILDESSSNNLKNVPEYNVLIIGIDNLSRLNFHRTMPKTMEFLKTREAVELLGYNKVGDNSYPNILAMLLSITESELKETCHPKSQAYFDPCPFIWNRFKEKGYFTAYGEESYDFGTFNYYRNGFLKSPTDYYMRPYLVEANNADFNNHLCMNEHYFYKILLNYIDDIINTTYSKASRLFGFFWGVTMSHDNLNFPMFMDDDYERFLKKLENSKYLDKTILFVVSDHGMRWGPIRQTRQGYLEERLPLTHILLPLSFQMRYETAFLNLKLNSHRLTTPFDIHETLLDLTTLENIRNDVINSRSEQPYALKRGISLFLRVPDNRTCDSASIDDHYCTCHKFKNIPKSSAVAVEAVNHTMIELNSLLENYTMCSKLQINDVVNVKESLPRLSNETNENWKQYTVVLRTEPGGGLFEATIRHDGDTWQMAGTISRLNRYGDQSKCMHQPHLQLYCYCIN